ncbi:adenylate kinase [Oscillospiraceae bacterium 50-60]
MLERIIVIGCPGAGKSTLARRLRDETGLPLYYLDMIWHKPDQTTVSRDEFDSRLREIVSGDKWIVDGNYGRTLEMRFQFCDTVFLLDLPADECLTAAESRIGKPREDLPWLETEFDEEFRQWILNFSRNELPTVYRLIDRYRGEKDIYIFYSRDDIERYLEKTFGRQPVV